MKGTHILLTTDLSEESLRAFAPVADLARRLDARVTLLHVVHDQVHIVPPASPNMPVMKMDPEEAAKAAQENLEELRQRLDAAPQVVIDTVVSQDVATAIVERGAAHAADFLAMATHGHSGIKRMLLGSTAEQVVRHSTIPVILYPPPR